jgi:hypothetical protein
MRREVVGRPERIVSPSGFLTSCWPVVVAANEGSRGVAQRTGCQEKLLRFVLN